MMHGRNRSWPAVLGTFAAMALSACIQRSLPVLHVPGDSPPKEPFELRIVQIAPVKEGVVAIEYRLTNTTAVGISACASSWQGARILRENAVFELEYTHHDGRLPEQFFRIPPFGTLIWRRDIEIPTGVTGSFKLLGVVRSDCDWLWNGAVQSPPLTIELSR